MERKSDSAHTAPVYEDILDRLERIIELMEHEPEWDVCDTAAGGNPGSGWEPFAVTSPSPGVHFVWWRRRR